MAEDFAESRVDTLIEHIKALFERIKAPVDRDKPDAEELDELLVLAIRHVASLPHIVSPFKCRQEDNISLTLP